MDKSIYKRLIMKGLDRVQAMGNQMGRDMKGMGLSLKWTLAYSLFILLVAGSVTIGLYIQITTAQKEAHQERLEDILNFSIPLVDGDYHSMIIEASDENSAFYRVLSLRLLNIHDTSDVITRIYTLREDDYGDLFYVLDSDPEDQHHFGDEYIRVGTLLEHGLYSIKYPVVENIFFKNGDGTYLSGYAPIYDQFENLDGVLGIDIDASGITSNQRKARHIAFIAFLITIPLSLLLGWMLAKYLTSPIQDLLQGADRIADGNLDELVPVRTQDELGALASAFNTMMGELRHTLVGLENEVEEHKKAEKVKDAIYRISQAAISSENLQELYREIHNVLRDLFSVDNYYIALYDSNNDLIEFPYYVDQFDSQPDPVRPGHGLTEYVMRLGKPVLVRPEIFEHLIKDGNIELVGTKPVDWLGVPLIVEGRLIGVMVTQSYGEDVRFDDENLEIFEILSSQVAQSIERKRVEAALARENKLLTSLMDNIPEEIYFKDMQSRFIHINSQTANHMRISDPYDAVGKTDFDYYAREHAEQAFQDEQKIIETRQPIIGKDEREVFPDGSICWVSTTKMPLYNSQGKIMGTFGVSRDITERKQAEEVLRNSTERYRNLFENSPISIWVEDFSEVRNKINHLRDKGIKDIRGYLLSHSRFVKECISSVRVLDVNNATVDLFGAKSKQELITNLDKIIPIKAHEIFVEELALLFDGVTKFRLDGINRTLDGRLINIDLSWSATPGCEDNLSNVIVSLIDITMQKQAETKLVYLSSHDALTRLYNRAYFDEEMDRLERGRTKPVSIVIADTDNLKAVNDQFGHTAGDQLLKSVADALRGAFRKEDMIARIGGDEFGVLLPGIDAQGVEEAVERIRQNIIAQNGSERGFEISLSIGTSTSESGKNLKEVFKDADQKMYQEKQEKSGEDK